MYKKLIISVAIHQTLKIKIYLQIQIEHLLRMAERTVPETELKYKPTGKRGQR